MTDGFNSKEYWEERYRYGGNSGGGSYDRLAEFKAEIVNAFVEKNRICSVVEWGCGDGNQLSLMQYEDYLGLDVSETAIRICREHFRGDEKKQFEYYDGKRKKIDPTRDMAVSLDVIYHLAEDAVYEHYMDNLFASSHKYVCIYSSNYERKWKQSHVRRRVFTEYVEKRFPEWKLITHIPNRYPAVKGVADPGTSNSEFYFYQLEDQNDI